MFSRSLFIRIYLSLPVSAVGTTASARSQKLNNDCSHTYSLEADVGVAP
jgi:hypothetical protein